jgi:ABC-type Fe3+-siderophore transport system permease subunit
MTFLVLFGQILLVLGVCFALIVGLIVLMNKVIDEDWHPITLALIPIVFAAGAAALVTFKEERHHAQVIEIRQEATPVH